MLTISLTIACSRYIYNGVILHAHPVRGESHNQRHTTGEIATLLSEQAHERPGAHVGDPCTRAKGSTSVAPIAASILFCWYSMKISVNTHQSQGKMSWLTNR